MIITEKLFQQALIEPATEGANELWIVSGYATSAMAYHHLENLLEMEKKVQIKILVGMCSIDGLSLSNHRGFQKLSLEKNRNEFSCSYVFKNQPVHSKAYIWFENKAFKKAFVGSANYTQNAFSLAQRELLTQTADSSIVDYFQRLETDSIFCDLPEAEDFIGIYNDKNYYSRHRESSKTDNGEECLIPNKQELETITVSLLDRNGKVQKTAGLNWGQREGRNPNQAYIQLSPEVYRSTFFPPRTIHFTVLTDDNKTLICTRAQKTEEGAAIETPQGNSFLESILEID